MPIDTARADLLEKDSVQQDMIIGVTGHQELGSDETAQWVRLTLREIIAQEPIDLGLTCLARGADQLFAELLLEKGIPYTAILASRDLEKTFDDQNSLEKYGFLLRRAADVTVLDNESASEEAFFAAGKQVVDRCDCLIAVWNGLPAKGLGGTGDVVKYALEKHKKVIHIDPVKLIVTLLGNG